VFAAVLLLTLGSVGVSAAHAQAAAAVAATATPPPGPLPQTFEQLRVNSVADQLIRYLGQVVRWVDVPGTRAPTSVLPAS
jgi:hypothetical protein